MKEVERIKAALDADVKGYGNLNHTWATDKDDDGNFSLHIVGANVDGELYPVLEIDTAQYFQETDAPKLAEYYAACNPDAMSKVLAHITALGAENERLTECLKKANAQAEHFEREWYLRGDEVERLRKDAERKPIDNDCTPNHMCSGRMVHLPHGEQCDKCGEGTP